VSDLFPAELEVLFRVPQSVEDTELRAAIEQLADSVKADLVATGAPAEVVMEASVCVNQFAKHMQASRIPYGHTEKGSYTDPGSERAALSSLHNGLTALREALFKLRVVQANPAQVQAAVEERDQRFARVAQALFKACRGQLEPQGGEELMFWVQSVMFPAMREEGLVE
jgi:hypothetical protein